MAVRKQRATTSKEYALDERHNVFKEKTEEELIVLYGQFLESEKLGCIPDNELGKIRDKYFEWYNAMTLMAVQVDLLRAVSDMWFKHNVSRECGHWIDYGCEIECSVCGFTCNDEYYLGKKIACPNCGALMNKEKIGANE